MKNIFLDILNSNEINCELAVNGLVSATHLMPSVIVWRRKNG